MVFDGIDSSRVLFAADFPVAAMVGRRAVSTAAAGLTEGKLRQVFFDNGMKVLRSVRNGTALKLEEEKWQA